jgi:hypothetical protein
MKVVVRLPADTSARLIDILDDIIQQYKDTNEAIEQDGSLDLEGLLVMSAETHEVVRVLTEVKGLTERGIAVMADPSLLQHSETVYVEMLERSKLHREGEVSIVVYEGALTHLVMQDLGFPNPYYTKIKNMLEGMGCMKQLKRGGGGQPSQWELIKSPTRELYDEWEASAPDEEEEVETASAQAVKDLNDRLLVVEKALGLVG